MLNAEMSEPQERKEGTMKQNMTVLQFTSKAWASNELLRSQISQPFMSCLSEATGVLQTELRDL